MIKKNILLLKKFNFKFNNIIMMDSFLKKIILNVFKFLTTINLKLNFFYLKIMFF
jgi:hypothetical protein